MVLVLPMFGLPACKAVWISFLQLLIVKVKNAYVENQ